jgi:hypothetical protein
LIASASALVTCASAVWTAPPRFDGAGYAVLARGLRSGQGYRAIDHPDHPPHIHFPPGYPLVLALLWWVTGESVVAAHVVSTLCTAGAAVAGWWWFRRLVSARAALLLGLALSVNWLWARTGSAIQSEPLYMLLQQLAILAAARAGHGTTSGLKDAILLAVLLAGCLLIRHVAVGLVLAVALELAIGRGWRFAVTVAALAGVFTSPWLTWMVAAGSTGQTQASLLVQGGETWLQRLARQVVFYVERIPDQITGPFVEVGVNFGRWPWSVVMAAGVWAVVATAVIACGWLCTLHQPRRRLAGLVALCTMLVLLVWPFTEAGRFLIPLVPCILIGAVEGLTGLARRFQCISLPRGCARPIRRRLGAASLVLSVSVPYSAYMLVMGRARAFESMQRDFDAACGWLAAHPKPPGPVLTRHPGEVFWLTGRQALAVPTAERPGEVGADAAAIARTIEAYRVSYLLVDQARYARAPASPLARFVAEHPEQVRKVWGDEEKLGSVMLYQVVTSNQSGLGPSNRSFP